MKQSGHLNTSEETGTACPITSRYGRTPPTKHVGRQQKQCLEWRINTKGVEVEQSTIYTGAQGRKQERVEKNVDQWQL